MWLLTRSRPDLMYAMSKMCQNTLKNPLEVMEVGNQVMKYLRKTIHQGVEFGVEKGGLEVYTIRASDLVEVTLRALWQFFGEDP